MLVSVCYFIEVGHSFPPYYADDVELTSGLVDDNPLYYIVNIMSLYTLIERNYLASYLYSMKLACLIRAITVCPLLKIPVGSRLIKPSTKSCRYLYKHVRVLIHFNNAKMTFCKAVGRKGLWAYTSSSRCQILTGGRAKVVLHPDFFHVL